MYKYKRRKNESNNISKNTVYTMKKTPETMMVFKNMKFQFMVCDGVRVRSDVESG